jgi:hypothetical protein
VPFISAIAWIMSRGSILVACSNAARTEEKPPSCLIYYKPVSNVFRLARQRRVISL